MLLIDGGLIFRNFFALPPMQDKAGRPVNAVYGFMAMTLREMAEVKATHVAVACDVPIATNRRVSLYPEYKGNRPACPDELAPQFDMLRDVMSALNIPWFQVPGYEADDILGTFSRTAEDAGMDVSILTGDRDVLQLLSSKTQVRYVRKLNNPDTYDVGFFANQYGILPNQLIDLKGLAGDASDNLPGIKGIGEKTAVKLIQEFETLENILDNAHTQKGKLRERLEEGREIAKLCKQLATIDRAVPDLPACDVCELSLNLEGGRTKFEEYRFRSLMGRLVG